MSARVDWRYCKGAKPVPMSVCDAVRLRTQWLAELERVAKAYERLLLR